MKYSIWSVLSISFSLFNSLMELMIFSRSDPYGFTSSYDRLSFRSSRPDFMRFINVLDSTDKLLFGYCLPCVLAPYLNWQFSFTVGRGVSDCLAIQYSVRERAYRASWCISEQFWARTSKLRSNGYWWRFAVFAMGLECLSLGFGFWRTQEWGKGDNLGPGLYRRSYDALSWGFRGCSTMSASARPASSLLCEKEGVVVGFETKWWTSNNHVRHTTRNMQLSSRESTW